MKTLIIDCEYVEYEERVDETIRSLDLTNEYVVLYHSKKSVGNLIPELKDRISTELKGNEFTEVYVNYYPIDELVEAINIHKSQLSKLKRIIVKSCEDESLVTKSLTEQLGEDYDILYEKR